MKQQRVFCSRAVSRAGCVVLLLAGLQLAVLGCNPVFLNQISGGGFAPLAPGDTPYVLTHVINSSSYTIDVLLSLDVPALLGQPLTVSLTGIEPGSERGDLEACPVNRIALGSITDQTETAISFTTDDGARVSIPSSAFPFILESGVNYDCGDAVLFTIIDDRNSPFLVTVIPSRVPAGTQTGSFIGPDTFENFDVFVSLLTGLPTPID
jgi:hypothetical protein